MVTLSIIHLQHSFNKILKLQKKTLLTAFSYSYEAGQGGWLVTRKIYAHIKIWGGTTFFYMYAHRNNLAFNSEHMQACHTEVMLLIPGR